MTHLVIVESPAKGKTIGKYLGKDYVVEASFGHIRDLPTKKMGVDIEHGFTPEYEISPEKKKRVVELKKLAKSSERVWIATDEDREGEAIWWHLCEALNLDPKSTARIVFHEITKTAIDTAIDHPRTIDMDLVDAQQARRVLDRIVGYEVSPVLWKKVRPWLSAGRVQSVAVKLIVEREREIRAFIPEETWKIKALVTGRGIDFAIEFVGLKWKKLKNETDAMKFLATLGISLEQLQKELDKKWNILLSGPLEKKFTLYELDKKETYRFPGAPFTTSTLQQEASRKLWFWVKMTMDIAQQLYQEWYITYMRTDSVNLSEFAIRSAHAYILQKYGAEYALPNGRRYKTKQANAQEAHEAIRPTAIEKSPERIGLEGPKKKLYTLIWDRTVASQMKEARIETTTFRFHPDLLPDQVWIAKWEIILFPWFMKLYIEGTDDEWEDQEGTMKLPDLKQWDTVESRSIQATQKFSLPPPRYTEAMLVKKLESEGIGRPSTYAPTIQTILDRWYIEKEEKKLKPTDIAFVVTDYLEAQFRDFMQYNFTASVEAEFDAIALGKLKWQEMIDHFYRPFHEKIIAVLDSNERFSGERVLGKDPKTGNTVLVRMSRFGPVVQIGKPDELWDNQKPQYANLPSWSSLETLSFEDAMQQFSLPKFLGIYEERDVSIGSGRFWPYVKYGESYVSIPRDDNPITFTLDQAIRLIEEKKKTSAAICTYLWENVTKGKGRFGPFIKWKNLYVNVPKSYDWENLAESDCKILIDQKRKKESERIILEYPEANISIEKGKWWPFIRHKKDSYKLLQKGKKVDPETLSSLSREDVRDIIIDQNPKAFSSSNKKETPKKWTGTKKKKWKGIFT